MRRWGAVIAAVAVGAATGAASAVGADPLRGDLRIREHVIDTGAVYIEGAYQYVEVRRTRDDRLMFRKRSGTGLSERVVLPAGFYRVASWTQSCSGTCGMLDPPSNRCRGSFRVRGGRYLTATIHSGVGISCRITNP